MIHENCMKFKFWCPYTRLLLEYSLTHAFVYHLWMTQWLNSVVAAEAIKPMKLCIYCSALYKVCCLLG